MSGDVGDEVMSTVCVHGLGHVGLPTAAMFANEGFEVIGYDTDEGLLDRLRSGGVPDTSAELQAFVERALETGRFRLQSEIPSAEFHMVCVPTPLNEITNSADLTYVDQVGEALAPVVSPGDTVVLQSTVPPGTTEGSFRTALERGGLEAGRDFRLAHVPETVLPGAILEELYSNDRIVGGLDTGSTKTVCRLYRDVIDGELHVAPDAKTAEFAKLAQNTYRDTNIALANEFARIAGDYGIHSRNVIELANRHPRVEIHQPGPGVGGHCLPIDPLFLGAESDQLDLILHGRRINTGMVDYLIEMVRDELGRIERQRIAILGVAYKGNVADTRKSPGLRLAKAFQSAAREESGLNEGESPVDVRLHDSHVTDQTVETRPLDQVLEGADAIVVTADHDEYEEVDPEYALRKVRTPFVVDSKAILDERKWREAGFTLRVV